MFAGTAKAMQNFGHRLTVTLPSLCRAISSSRSCNLNTSDVKCDQPQILALKNAFDFDPSLISMLKSAAFVPSTFAT